MTFTSKRRWSELASFGPSLPSTSSACRPLRGGTRSGSICLTERFKPVMIERQLPSFFFSFILFIFSEFQLFFHHHPSRYGQSTTHRLFFFYTKGLCTFIKACLPASAAINQLFSLFPWCQQPELEQGTTAHFLFSGRVSPECVCVVSAVGSRQTILLYLFLLLALAVTLSSSSKRCFH